MKEKPQLKSKDLPKEEDEAKSESPKPPTRSSIGGRSGDVAAEPGRGRMGWGWLFECRVCCLVEGKSTSICYYSKFLLLKLFLLFLFLLLLLLLLLLFIII